MKMPLHCANYSLVLWEYTSAAGVFQGDVLYKPFADNCVLAANIGQFKGHWLLEIVSAALRYQLFFLVRAYGAGAEQCRAGEWEVLLCSGNKAG